MSGSAQDSVADNENKKLIQNLISYFNETQIINQFKYKFLEVVRDDMKFQEKMNQLIEKGEKPETEQIWKKILELEGDLLTLETKSKLFCGFEEVLQELFQKDKL